jgi:hypothetical protein
MRAVVAQAQTTQEVAAIVNELVFRRNIKVLWLNVSNTQVTVVYEPCEVASVTSDRPVRQLKAAPQQETAPEVVAAPKKLTYAGETLKRASDLFGFEIKSKAQLKSALINKADLSFMGAVNLERSGREFYEAANFTLDKWEAARFRRHLEKIATCQQQAI